MTLKPLYGNKLKGGHSLLICCVHAFVFMMLLLNQNFTFGAVVLDRLFVFSEFARFFINPCNSHDICSFDAESGMLNILSFFWQ
jgi:hypothetical protein